MSVKDMGNTWMLKKYYNILNVFIRRFSDCIARGSFNEVTQRNCTEEGVLAGEMKSYSAIAILLFSISTLIFASKYT